MYPKRLIEVDLPIKEISAHARREKSIRHGHISTLHIWWARRPLAACRAVICAALWPDPADDLCPPAFRGAAARILCEFAEKARNDKVVMELCQPHWSRWSRTTSEALDPADPSRWPQIRQGLLDFIADFANWDASTVPPFLEASRALTQAAHEALGGAPGTKPLVVDPFAGGGSIPLEALRVGADAFASDLNPVAVLLNKVVLEYIPKYGQRLADEVRKWGEWIKKEAEKELAEFYPKDPDGSVPIAYLWARTIRCEGPGCGAEVPLIRSLWLAKKPNRSVALHLLPRPKAKQVTFKVIVKQPRLPDGSQGGWVDQDDPKTKIKDPKFDGTVKRGSATCPCCGYTTSAENTRKQFIPRAGGADDARLLAVVVQDPGRGNVRFRLGTKSDMEILKRAAKRVGLMERTRKSSLSVIPDESLPYLRSIFNINLLGVDTWGKLFNSRQALALATLVAKTRSVPPESSRVSNVDLSVAIVTCLACAVDRCADYWSSLAVWAGDFVAHTFGRQALGIIWDYAEVNGFADGSGNYTGAVEWICRVIERLDCGASTTAGVEKASACQHPLPDDSAHAFVTDPPYYDAVPYADLADFFYVWLRRSIGNLHPSLFQGAATPKDGEIVQLSERNPIYARKTREYFESLMKEAMAEGRRVLDPTGVGIVVFAHKTTAGWETQLQAMIDGGWVVTASWPIDTERPGRLRANDSAALASSVHLVCRPRESADGSVRTDEVGDWRDVLGELPRRIHEWMPRLAEEGVVGADAIFACLGPALEIFSRYSRVEKASGEVVTLKEYLEHVWAAVAKEALNMIFEGADATGFEEDARLTAMWLWTLKTGERNGNGRAKEEETEDDEEEGTGTKGKMSGFALEYDAARKIAQGLGAHLETLTSVVEVKGETARLLPVTERTRFLFAKDEAEAPGVKRKKKEAQLKLGFAADLEKAEESGGWGQKGAPRQGETVLDRVHQAMILFAAGRGEALRRFLVEEGVGRDDRFWRLAQALAALYPPSTDERRWVEGVMGRKKGLGF
jgi:adenine-specific DNA methylase